LGEDLIDTQLVLAGIDQNSANNKDQH